MSLSISEPARKKRRGTKKAAGKAMHAMADGGVPSDVIDIPQEPMIEVADNVSIDAATGAVQIDHDDGSITIDPTGESLRSTGDGGSETFDENLADRIDAIELGRIANDLIDAIQADKQDRSQWEQMRAKCIELLGMKLEDPRGDVSRSAMGVSTSVVRDPILLEAVERFRANAYAELCPSAGPVKVVNFSDNKAETNDLANALQKDLNYYLTTTASEYYPDTRYMLWWTGLASGTFKKVYKCPLRNRPVSEFVDGTDLIVPSSATDLKNATRVTHEVTMPRDIMRAMQIEGVYRDVPLAEPMQSVINPVAAKVANTEGKAPQSQRIEDQEYTVYECYCKLDIKGYEHKVKGKPTGLPLPYRVTIEESSREVLEIRRNWDEADDDETYRPPNIPFVLFPYSTGISRIYGSGLGQMLGNMASALTALLRISIDGGMMSNYPGLLKAKGEGRQVQNEIMVPPGGVSEIDTGGLPIQQVVMGMPFKDVSGSVVSLIEQTRGVAQRLGGTADMPVGEGKQDAPVGTTLALIEQSTKVEGSVHKALHAAQTEEFRLLVKLFRDDPEALWRGNRRPAMGSAQDDAAREARQQMFIRALDNCDIVPMADPNVPSDMHRNLMAMGVKQFTTGNLAYDPIKVDRYVAKQMFKMSDADFNAMLAPPAMGPPQIDPVLQAQMQLENRKIDIQEAKVAIDAQKLQLAAQNAEQDRQLKGNIESMKIASQYAAATGGQTPEVPDDGVDPLKVAELRLKAAQVQQKDKEIEFKAANAHLDRQSKETLEAMKIAQAVAVHPGSDDIVDEQLLQMGSFLKPTSEGRKDGGKAPSMSDGGRVGYALGGSPGWSGQAFNASNTQMAPGQFAPQAQMPGGVSSVPSFSPFGGGATPFGQPPMQWRVPMGGGAMQFGQPPRPVVAQPRPQVLPANGGQMPLGPQPRPQVLPSPQPVMGQPEPLQPPPDAAGIDDGMNYVRAQQPQPQPQPAGGGAVQFGAPAVLRAPNPKPQPQILPANGGPVAPLGGAPGAVRSPSTQPVPDGGLAVPYAQPSPVAKSTSSVPQPGQISDSGQQPYVDPYAGNGWASGGSVPDRDQQSIRRALEIARAMLDRGERAPDYLQ